MQCERLILYGPVRRIPLNVQIGTLLILCRRSILTPDKHTAHVAFLYQRPAIIRLSWSNRSSRAGAEYVERSPFRFSPGRNARNSIRLRRHCSMSPRLSRLLRYLGENTFRVNRPASRVQHCNGVLAAQRPLSMPERMPSHVSRLTGCARSSKSSTRPAAKIMPCNCRFLPEPTFPSFFIGL